MFSGTNLPKVGSYNINVVIERDPVIGRDQSRRDRQADGAHSPDGVGHRPPADQRRDSAGERFRTLNGRQAQKDPAHQPDLRLCRRHQLRPPRGVHRRCGHDGPDIGPLEPGDLPRVRPRSAHHPGRPSPRSPSLPISAYLANESSESVLVALGPSIRARDL